MDRLALVMGGGALAAYSLLRARGASASTATTLTGRLPGRWVWPVQSWNGRRPAISSGFNSPRPGLPRHGGVDIMFERRPSDAFKAGTPNGAKNHVMPDDIAVLAAADGIVWSAMQTPRGHAVVIEHSPLSVATFYAHLDRINVTPTARAETKQRVRAGQLLGTVGFSPLDGEKLKHLHFEVWLGGPSARIDPQQIMTSWEVLGDPREQLVARNAGLTYRPVGSPGDAYPQWVRDLKGKSGVYVIRERGETVYVGSSIGRLYDTLTRHLQTWRRWKGFWKGQYGEGHDPGLTYRRDRVAVAVRLTSPDEALAEEERLIRRLQPRDNLLLQPEEEVIPF